MNKLQINYLNMQDNVLAHLENNESIWVNRKPFAKKVALLKTNNAALHKLNDEQKEKGTVGYTDQKNNALGSIIGRSYKLAANLADWAMDTNNLILLNEVNYSESAMDDGTENEIEKRCERIAKHGKTHAKALIGEGYDVVEAEIDELLIDIAEEQKLVTMRDIESGKQVNTTATIPQLIAESRIILKSIDKQIAGSKIEDEAFIGTYKALRYIGGWAKLKNNDENPPVV